MPTDPFNHHRLPTLIVIWNSLYSSVTKVEYPKRLSVWKEQIQVHKNDLLVGLSCKLYRFHIANFWKKGKSLLLWAAELTTGQSLLWLQWNENQSITLSLDGFLVHHRIPSMKWQGVSTAHYSLDGMLVHLRIPSMKWQGVFYSPTPLDGMPVHYGPPSEVTRSITTPSPSSLLDGRWVHHRVPSVK